MMRSLPSPTGGVRSALCAGRGSAANEEVVIAASLRKERRGISKRVKNRGVFIGITQSFENSFMALLPIAAGGK
jgi:hypothetical protein